MSEGLQRQLDSLAHTAKLVGIQEERARILKLLEEDAGDWHQISERCDSGYCHCHAIALIKGEEK